MTRIKDDIPGDSCRIGVRGMCYAMQMDDKGRRRRLGYHHQQLRGTSIDVVWRQIHRSCPIRRWSSEFTALGLKLTHSATGSCWYNSHTAPLLKKLKLLTVKDILALQELKFYYKFTHNELPAYFQNWQIVRNSEIHTHNTSRQHDIHIVGIKHTFAKRCIRINLPRTLNNTPQIVKDKLLTHSFRGFINYANLTFYKATNSIVQS